MSSPILVTGAAGFVGGHLLDLLLQRSTPVVGWHHPGAPPTVHVDALPWMAIEMLDKDAVNRAIADIRPSAIYHLAGAAHVGQSWKHTFATYQINVLATHRLFDALRAAQVKPRVLIAGSATIYKAQDRPIRETDQIAASSPYATSKLAQEMVGRDAWQNDAIPALLARSFNHFGPRQDPSFIAPGIARQIALIEAGQQEPVLTMGNLEPRRDLTDVRDTVRAYVAMMERADAGKPYNVCSGRALAMKELVEAFVARSHRPVRIVQDPSRFRPNDTPLLVGDHSQLHADTDWRPRLPLGQTVDDLLAYWRDHIGY